ncbi:Sau3AI family type II restriction endonuclease [Lysinibacillus piscis]|uniref:DNA mismatch repair protein MutH n=1 Tax=Lysinibacillus piscis TaxID=2518931 RepID=A0ABQ5NFX7_9BACI|nr:Sau3AI family type II restriction endonuclease [Lysinibacillus sp. KH24]GLC87298.1 DNA mismatch repair protein MutH [Lysinibacillus sp. KH24]
MLYKNERQLLAKAQEAIGKTFNEIDQHDRLSKNQKGGFGHIIEESHFGYEINSNAEPDFKELGIELKVTPFRKNKNGTLSAKERLVLNIINYMEEVHTEFETSSFWHKNRKLLLMFYEWQQEINRGDFRIIETILYDYPEEDLIIIKKDWAYIVEKIRKGEAHLLSEGDTQYLGACTKGANKNSVRQQPYSDISASQRAYSLKQSYMTSIVREVITNEKLTYFASKSELREKTLEELLQERFSLYIGMTQEEMAAQLGVPFVPSNKAFIANLISSLLGVKGTRLDKVAEFAKANIQFKTVRLKENGVPKEHMSFVNINFKEIVQEDWEESYIRDYFLETQLLFVVFQFNAQSELIFKGIKLWHMPMDTIETKVYEYWQEIRRVVNEGIQLHNTSRGVKNNLPDTKFNNVLHVRPKGRNAADQTELPDGQRITKQCYWLNDSYIANILKYM